MIELVILLCLLLYWAVSVIITLRVDVKHYKKDDEFWYKEACKQAEINKKLIERDSFSGDEWKKESGYES